MLPELQPTPLVIPFVVSAVVTTALTVYGIVQIRRTGRDKTTLAFLAIVGMITVWTVARVAEYLVVSHVLTRLSIAILYVGFGGAAMAILFFSLAFTGRQRYLTRRTVGALLVVPAVAIFIAGTNDYYHELFWEGEFVEMSGWYGTILVYDREFQPLFHAYFLYTAGSVIVGLLLLLRLSFESPAVYRRQTIAFVSGSAAALILAVLFVVGRQPVVPNSVDMTPIGFAIMGLCFWYAIFQYRLLDLVPVARDTVIDTMRDGYLVLDADDRIVDLNPSAAAILETQSPVGDRIETVLPSAEAAIREVPDEERTQSEIEVPVGGEPRVYSLTVSPLYEGGTRIGRLVLLGDVTERRAVRKRYQALIDNTSDVILVVDRDLTVSYASPSIESIVGLEAAAVIGTQALELVHEDDREAFADVVDELFETPGVKLREEYRSFDAVGELRHFEASIWNLLDTPFVEGIVVNARDITERKEREAELEAANDRLTEANNQLEQFADVISHDLRNPINVAQGHLEFAQDDDRVESFETMRASLERMEAIIDDVLTLARQGEAIGDTSDVYVEAMAERAWGHVRTDGASLQVDGDGTMQADPDRLCQLLENLFRNACDHAGEDVLVRVGIDGDVLFVEDDGPGIPPDRREAVLESGHTTHPDGTGLGLSIVTQIASGHGWEVTVTEGTAGGARFEFAGIDSEPSAK